jgi:hypothetical protein
MTLQYAPARASNSEGDLSFRVPIPAGANSGYVRYGFGTAGTLVPPGFAVAEGEATDRCVQARFEMLAWWWHEDTDGLSSPRQKIEHPAYRYIIEGLGASALPFILNDLRDRGGSWFHALRSLTAGPEIPEQDRGNARAIKERWLAWGRERGLIA